MTKYMHRHRHKSQNHERNSVEICQNSIQKNVKSSLFVDLDAVVHVAEPLIEVQWKSDKWESDKWENRLSGKNVHSTFPFTT